MSDTFVKKSAKPQAPQKKRLFKVKKRPSQPSAKDQHLQLETTPDPTFTLAPADNLMTEGSPILGPQLPATRVGEGKKHHDLLAPGALLVLVDQPTDTRDLVTLKRQTKAFPTMATNSAEPLSDTILVFALVFEPVHDSGKFTLSWTRVDSEAVLFEDIDFKSLFFYDPDLTFGPQNEGGVDFAETRRLLNYHTVPARPQYHDLDLDQDTPPFAQLIPQ